HAAALANAKDLRRVQSLILDEPFAFRTPEGLRTILSSRHLTGLRTLSLANDRLANYPPGQRRVRLLAEGASMAQIEALELRNYGFGEGDVAALAALPHLGRLRRLRLGSCVSFNQRNLSMYERSVDLLLRELAPLVGRLEFLGLNYCGITPAGLQLLGTVKRSV